MPPGQKVWWRTFDSANRAPDRRDAMSPNRRGITKTGDGNVVHQIKGRSLMQLTDESAGLLVPKHTIKLQARAPPAESLQIFLAIEIDKTGDRLPWSQVDESALDVMPVLALGKHSHVVEAGHLNGPLPADLRLRTLIR